VIVVEETVVDVFVVGGLAFELVVRCGGREGGDRTGSYKVSSVPFAIPRSWRVSSPKSSAPSR
jgi:hypothetical protein